MDEGHCEKKVNGLVVNAECAGSWLRCAFYRLDHVRRAKRALDEMRGLPFARSRAKERPMHLNKIASAIQKAMERHKESDDVQNEVYKRAILFFVHSVSDRICHRNKKHKHTDKK